MELSDLIPESRLDTSSGSSARRTPLGSKVTIELVTENRRLRTVLAAVPDSF